MTDDASIVRSRASSVHDAGATLRATGVETRADWLAEAAARLAGRARDASQALSDATGLSIPMVEWATETTLSTVREDVMLALVARAQEESGRALRPISMLSIVLAGNVFTAPVRGILAPLLFGVPVLVKAASTEALFSAMLREALRSTASELGAAMEVVAFSGGDLECEAALVELADKVSVYGSDDTVAIMAARLGADRLIAHGHGVSVAFCGADALEDARINDTIARLSLDICAYDQRGCLSPQVVYVEETPRLSARDFGERLAETGLDPMSQVLPRGPLPAEIGAAQAQWRGMAEVEGVLLSGDTYAVSIPEAGPIRWSPGFRNVTIASVRELDDALSAMEPIGSNLKCVGADRASIGRVRASLANSAVLSAVACTLGEMQTPTFDAPADGRPIWQGLSRP